MLASSSTRLFTVGQLDSIRVEIVLTDRMLAYVEEGQRTEVTTTRLTASAPLSRISPFTSRSTRDMGSLTTLYTDKAIAYLKEKRDPSKPFVLYVAHTMMHTIIDASSRFKGKSKGSLYGDVVEELELAPLATPTPRRGETLEPAAEVEACDAVQLFIARARQANPRFLLTEENAPDVAEIVRQLDGLPLAIELGASRLRLLTPQSLLERLEHRCFTDNTTPGAVNKQNPIFHFCKTLFIDKVEGIICFRDMNSNIVGAF